MATSLYTPESMQTCTLHSTCPRDDPHDDSIQDRLGHYLGCVEIEDRPRFFDLDGKQYRIEFDRILHKLSTTRGVPTGRLNDIAGRTAAQLMDQWKQRCMDHLDRTQHLRESLRHDHEECHLVYSVEESYKLWSNSHEYKRGLPVVQAWRGGGKVIVVEEETGGDSTKATEKRTSNQPSMYSYEPDRYTKARVIHFLGGKPVQTSLPGTVPNQYCLVSDLLDPGTLNIASRDYEQGRIKYFHLPSNNMSWVEGLMARYYSEEHPNIDRHTEEATHSNTVLRPESWRGQQLGGNNGINKPMPSRSMRPLCEKLPSDLSNPSIMGNMVLFMPYLHWETGSNHDAFSRFIQQTNFAFKRSAEARERSQRDVARRARAMLSAIRKPRMSTLPKPTEPIRSRLPSKNMRSVSEVVHVFQPVNVPGKFKKDKHERLLVSSPLGQFLMDASRLYSGMKNYKDKQLIKKYLHAHPPMHPRRTLDKAHALNTRNWRAKDQVVYRATSTNPGSFHHFDPVEGVWPDHECLGIYENCPDCLQNISNTPRLIMVDQLWMWVLDRSTIVTAFPVQYGDIKDPESDVHHAIRGKIASLHGNEIKSAFDIGLLVLEEVFDHLWEPAKALLHQQQPQVLSIFSKAICNVKTNQTIALSKFWHWSEIAQENYGRGDVLDLLKVPIQGIGGEGKLLVEIKDIIDELDTMMDLSVTQKVVMQEYINISKEMLRREESMEEYDWFCRNAEALRSKVANRIEVLQELENSASSAQTAIRDTLSLKEQQDGLTQAWRAEVQARENVNQGRSVMVFTVTSVVFLPLTWITGIFGMNAQNLGEGNFMNLGEQFAIMFPISASIIILTMVVAYSSQARRFVKTLGSLCMVTFRLYRVFGYLQWACRWVTNKMELRTVGQYREILRSEREEHLSRVRKRIKAEEAKVAGRGKRVEDRKGWLKRRLFERSMEGFGESSC